MEIPETTAQRAGARGDEGIREPDGSRIDWQD
jgi:hypothetical protein